MPKALIASLLEQAERAAPAVKAAALLYSARVVNTFDQDEDEAVRLLERGIAVAETLPPDDRIAILSSAMTIAGIVSPPHAMRLLPNWPAGSTDSPIMQAISNMQMHGRVADVVAYLDHPADGQPFPFTAASDAIGRSRDDETRRRILRSAIAAWREEMRGSGREFGRSAFPRLFSWSWTLLPAEEALAVVREMVQWILDAPDQPVQGAAGDLRFSSSREHALFQILGPIHRLDPALVESLAREYPQFAKAVARYPYGTASMIGELYRGMPSPPEVAAESVEFIDEPDYIVVGHQLVPLPEAAATEFAEPFKHAMALYAADVARNEAPIERWPSTWAFREILYKAGQHEGRAAAKYLDRIPHADLRLLAAIELAAGLANLAQLGGLTIGPRLQHASHDEPMPTADEAAFLERMKQFVQRQRPPARKPAMPTSLDVRIAPATRTIEDGPVGGAGADFWTMEGVPLKAVLSKICDTPGTRIELPPALESSRFDFHLVLPHDVDQQTMKSLMQKGIEKHFGVSITREKRSKDVYVLTAPDGLSAAKEIYSGAGGLSSGSVGWTSTSQLEDSEELMDRFEAELGQVMDLHMVASEPPATPEEAMQRMRGELARRMSPARKVAAITSISQAMTMAELAELLENNLDRLVVDETTLTDTFALQVDTDAKTTLDFVAELCRRTGLVVTPDRRDVPVVVLARYH